jgi:hypothetical protein
MNYRRFFSLTASLLAGAGLAGMGVATAATPEAWLTARSAARQFNVKAYHAKGDGKSLDTAAINQAIDACHADGGGVVYFPPGVYLSGTVVIKSNVTLYLEAGATLLGSKNIDDYSAHIGPRHDADANQKHLIFARDAENIGLAGLGKIDGQGQAFWVPSGRKVPPPEDSWRDVATYDWKPLKRPSPLLEFYNCKNLHIENVRIENAPGWTLRPIQCDDVFIRGITIQNPVIGPNTDGIDPTCCQNVFISNCRIVTGDDAICLKSESPYGGDVRPSKNITITNCVLSCCCNGLKFGTATKGGFENIVFSNSVIFNESVDLKARVISGIAIEMVDGGWVEGVVISNIRMQRVRTPIFIRRGNRRPREDGTPGPLRGVMIENMHATGAVLTSSITGLPGFDVEDVTLANIRIDSDEGGKAEWTGREIPEVAKSYPEARMFGRLPAYGLYCRHVTGLRLQQVGLKATGDEERPALWCEDVKNLDLGGLRSTPTAANQPVIKLVQTRHATLRDCLAPPGTRTFLDVLGDKTEHITLFGSDLTAAEIVVQRGADVPARALVLQGNLTPEHEEKR